MYNKEINQNLQHFYAMFLCYVFPVIAILSNLTNTCLLSFLPKLIRV